MPFRGALEHGADHFRIYHAFHHRAASRMQFRRTGESSRKARHDRPHWKIWSLRRKRHNMKLSHAEHRAGWWRQLNGA